MISVARLFSPWLVVLTAAMSPLRAEVAVEWRNLPLQQAMERVRSVGTSVMLDCRVDSGQDITYSGLISNDDGLITAFQSLELTVVKFGDLRYITSANNAAEIIALRERRKIELARLKPAERKPFADRGDTTWQRLARPSEIIVEIASQAELQLSGAELLPLDIWPAGELKGLTLADRLTIILAQFNLEWTTFNGETVLISRIRRPLAVKQIPKSNLRNARTGMLGYRRQQPKKIVITLTVRDQPAGEVIARIANSAGLELNKSPKVTTPWNTRVTLAFKEVTPENAIRLIVEKVGLTMELDRDVVSIRPPRGTR